MISVVIPLYNKENSIGRAVASVLGQTEQDFELLVVDDGSTDGGAEIVRRIGDARVRLISQPNAGVSAARNRGAKEAASSVVAFLDGDDIWEPDFLETVSALRERFPNAAVWATAYRMLDSSQQSRVVPWGGLPSESEGGLLDFFTPGRCALTSSTVLIDKSALFRVGGFPEGLAIGEDSDTWLRLALRYPVAWSPKVCAVIDRDAENRTDGNIYLGNFPFLQSARAYQEEEHLPALPDPVWTCLAQRHTDLFRNKLLAGERRVIHEIVRDFHHVRGYRLKCLVWYLLSWVPYPFVVMAWKIKRRLTGYPTALPQLRPMYRA